MQLGPGFRAQARTVITLSLFQLSLYSFSSWRRLLLFNGLDPLRNFNAGLWGYNLSWDTGYCRLTPSSGRRAMRTTALEKVFLYAAAAPLSILGSLGIVRVAFATLLATITHLFCGGNWLDDAGFSTSGPRWSPSPKARKSMERSSNCRSYWRTSTSMTRTSFPHPVVWMVWTGRGQVY
ncbi:hypothetical protein L218DRAFT_630042 [Marasmius fiardii PR-910]|nr:hypothetical protein L218DRAFT_630042 [Marasmius fiardii PR-910]